MAENNLGLFKESNSEGEYVGVLIVQTAWVLSVALLTSSYLAESICL